MRDSVGRYQPGPWCAWALLFILSAVLLVLGRPSPAVAQDVCTTSSPAVASYSYLGDLADLAADCTVLLEFKAGLVTFDPNTPCEARPNWDVSVSMAPGRFGTPPGWDGVTVEGTPPRVTELDFSGGWRCASPIPTSFGSLTSLTELDLSQNRLIGSIPTELGNLTNLTYLSLHSNQLSGPIPTEVADLTNLGTLQLHRNQLSGLIPVFGSSSAKMRILMLHTNPLTGPIPAEVAEYRDLQWFHIQGTDWTGTVPQEVLDAVENGWITQLQTNRRPTAPAIPDAAITPGTAFAYTTPAFTDRDGDSLTFEVRMETRAAGDPPPCLWNPTG